eukprot:1138897-Pyramimonas_sp.AAC.1
MGAPNVGDVVWAHIKGFPWWPGQFTYPSLHIPALWRTRTRSFGSLGFHPHLALEARVRRFLSYWYGLGNQTKRFREYPAVVIQSAIHQRVFDESSQYVTKKALAAKKPGCFLVAFFGDGTFGWFASTDIRPFEENFKELSKGSTKKQFLEALVDVKQALKASRLGKSQYPARSLPQLADYESEDEEAEYDQYTDKAL